MAEKKSIYLRTGTLRVKAKGYWFTSGGEKGPFGFYPHLKDRDGYPIYPDTQLHGDLRMAASWISSIEGRANDPLITEVFGDNPRGETRQKPSRLFITDLTLVEDSKNRWNFKRFEVKPRIAIDDETRAVEEHMLVFQEVAYLESLELSADIYLGYFDEKDKIESAKTLIDKAVALLSGFGQSRSRGYGRGEITIDWNDIEEFSFNPSNGEDIPQALSYTLTNLVHFRNKPVDPGSTQSLPSRRSISSEQLRAWFSRTYHSLFGLWPRIDEISLIQFPYLYPSVKSNGITWEGCPAPMTTLRNEEGKVLDTVNRSLSLKEKEVEDRENFFKTKTKPLTSDCFVTSNDDPLVFKIHTERRIRNQTTSNFATVEEGGLFVQEFINKGTHFSGRIRIEANPDLKDFLLKALFILKNIKPIINGAIFKVECSKIDNETKDFSKPLLVLSPIPFNPDVINFKECHYEKQGERVVLKDANIITLDTLKAYNTTLKRPKRPKIVIRPGSILFDEKHVSERENLLSWKGFGKDLKVMTEIHSEKADLPIPERKIFPLENEFFQTLKDMTPSQAGFLKEFLNRHRKLEEIKKVAVERKDKYKEKNKKGMAWIYERIDEYLKEDKTGDKMRAFINFLLDEIYAYQRGKRKREGT